VRRIAGELSSDGRKAAAGRAVIMAAVAALLALAITARIDGSGQRTSAVSLFTTTTVSPTTVTTVSPPGAPRSFNTNISAANGRTRVERSLPCDGGDGDAGYWHLQGEQALPAGILTAPTNPLRGDLRVFADLHSPYHTIRTSPEPVAAPGPVAAAAYLQPDASRVALSNARGTVKLALTSGSCSRSGRTFSFDGLQASGPGTWAVDGASGSYRSATGTGTFNLNSGFAPGADNPWTLGLTGNLTVLQPKLAVSLVETYWGHDGVDYATRQVAAVYRVTNVGAGDTFAASLTSASSPTKGASLIRILINGKNLLIDGNTPLSTFPRPLGDLSSTEDVLVTIVWQLPLPSNTSACKLVILKCEIVTNLGFAAPDALDLPTAHSASLKVKAPDLPPPL
jgi:hypothetical protein